jgi:hypothetical protein
MLVPALGFGDDLAGVAFMPAPIEGRQRHKNPVSAPDSPLSAVVGTLAGGGQRAVEDGDARATDYEYRVNGPR